ncbi:ParB/Srx family N-terminal domain-containing protein [Ochrobactrum quorumnocens]|uniref:ParB/Srx family N-terminal domain-containing protein n=1 Tax=Ochrobactrum quorumnocens TaxID=271865 RepID=UPI001F221C79|nr:ParB/Srx family N-terminal domain-containing protein [[Ochrobactrum] quorumnocens]
MDSDPNNVSKSYFKDSIDELAAILRAEGFQPLQNFVVRKGDKKGRFYVTAGERRRRALAQLAEKGEVEADFAVNCMVKDADHAAAVSLAENIMSEDMHPQMPLKHSRLWAIKENRLLR